MDGHCLRANVADLCGLRLCCMRMCRSWRGCDVDARDSDVQWRRAAGLRGALSSRYAERVAVSYTAAWADGGG